MNRDQRSSSHDPTSERAVDQSTQTASGIGTPDGPGVERNRADPDVVNRSHAASTPRRYDQPIEEDDDPLMPDDSSTPDSKI